MTHAITELRALLERVEEIKGRTYTEHVRSAVSGKYERITVRLKEGRCAQMITSYDQDHQCRNKPGHGLGGLFCKQHAKSNPETGE